MLRQLVVAVMGADVLPSDRSLMQQLSGGMPALGQADERLACFAVCDRVPAPAESSMMRCARTGKWTCTSVRVWSESSNLTQQRPVTVLATETQVIVSLAADR